MIEWRFGLPPLAARDAAPANLAEVLDLTSPARTDNPAIPTLLGAPRDPCSSLSTPARPPKALVSAAHATAPPTTALERDPRSFARTDLPKTGLDLPLLPVGAGLLLGAWGAYHAKRTGETGPLPLADPVADPDG